MTKKLHLCLALGLLATSPALAGTVYVPIVAPTPAGSGQATEVLITNATGTGPRTFTTTFLGAGTDGTQRATAPVSLKVWRGRTSLLRNPVPAGVTGLFEISAAVELTIEARLASPAGAPPYDPLPVISSRNAFVAGATAHLLGLRRDTLGTHVDLGVVNLGKTAAQCDVRLFRADATQIGQTATIGVAPLSLSAFDDALAILNEPQAADARAQVSCNQPFFAYAALSAGGRLSFVEPAETGASTLTPPGGSPQPPGNAIVFRADGVVHQPALGSEIRALTVPVERALSLRRFVIDLDVTPGPWTLGSESRGHNVIWVYRGVFRSNTIANVNTFGPPRSVVRNTSNVDLPARQVTAQEGAVALQQGVLYHFNYVYDAENGTITLTVSTDGQTVATVQHPATATNRTLTIPAAGFNVQLGHTAAQAQQGAEFPTYGWTYANLKIEMYPY